jgi:hypothetical protein
VSKKNSYMNNENIIKEGFFDNLLRAIVPKSVQKTISKAAQNKLEKEYEETEKKIEKLRKQSADARARFLKAMEKQYGYKPDKKKYKKFMKKRK